MIGKTTNVKTYNIVQQATGQAEKEETPEPPKKNPAAVTLGMSCALLFAYNLFISA